MERVAKEESIFASEPLRGVSLPRTTQRGRPEPVGPGVAVQPGMTAVGSRCERCRLATFKCVLSLGHSGSKHVDDGVIPENKEVWLEP
jgi:hypothetical protein